MVMAELAVFRLYILGQPDFENDNAQQTLTILAEYRTARKLCRVPIATGEVHALAQRSRDLRAYMIAGDPPFDENALIQLGGTLFDLIIRDDVRVLLSTAPAAAGFKPIPLEIVVEDRTIAGWPWEFLYDKANQRYLCREYHPISRSSFNLDPHPLPKAKPDPVQILFVLGATRRDPEADIAEQLNRHKDVFRSLEAKGLIRVVVIEAARPTELIRALAQGSYDILHFFGHAGYDPTRKEGYLRFDTEDNENFRYYANRLAGDLLGRNIRLVFLNACETAVGAADRDPARSSLAAAILGRGIPAIIATQFLMPDTSAHFFSTIIYGALSSGVSLIQAMRDGRQTMDFGTRAKTPDWGIPVLYAAYPDLVIFPRQKRQGRAQVLAADTEKANIQ